MKGFKVVQKDGKLIIAPITNADDKIIIKDDDEMSLKELKQQISEAYNIQLKNIELFIF